GPSARLRIAMGLRAIPTPTASSMASLVRTRGSPRAALATRSSSGSRGGPHLGVGRDRSVGTSRAWRTDSPMASSDGPPVTGSALPHIDDLAEPAWTPRDRATLLFVRRGHQILLIRKKRGLGAGKINAPGGRIEPGETPEQAARRELLEEV